MTQALVVGTVLALAVLSYVLYPLFKGGPPAVCSNCGPRPERNAVFCSNCGAPVE